MGKVYLIGAGPGDPDLLTVKAARLLARASIVLHDSLVSREVLAQIAPRAEIIDVGKRCGQKLLTQDEINALLVSYSSQHDEVVRLKGGDPLIFGRAGEEIEALRQAHIDFEVVPGITAALGAAAAAGISLSDRRAASQIVISTFSRRADADAMDWGIVTPATTLVLYMPGAAYAEVSERLRGAGLPDDLPCAIVSNATTAKQQIRWTNVAALSSEEKLPAPALLIVGRAAARRVYEHGDFYRATADPKHRRSSQQAQPIRVLEGSVVGNTGEPDERKQRSHNDEQESAVVTGHMGSSSRLRSRPADPHRRVQTHPMVK